MENDVRKLLLEQLAEALAEKGTDYNPLEVAGLAGLLTREGVESGHVKVAVTRAPRLKIELTRGGWDVAKHLKFAGENFKNLVADEGSTSEMIADAIYSMDEMVAATEFLELDGFDTWVEGWIEFVLGQEERLIEFADEALVAHEDLKEGSRGARFWLGLAALDLPLKQFEVTLHGERFLCLAESIDHAKEQARNAYPDEEVLAVRLCDEQVWDFDDEDDEDEDEDDEDEDEDEDEDDDEEENDEDEE